MSTNTRTVSGESSVRKSPGFGGLAGLVLLAVWASVLPASAATVTFQQGANGYTGTQDTWLSQSAPTTDNGAAATLRWDGDNPNGSGQDDLTLLRFDNIIGGGPGQVPLGATVTSATLTYSVSDVGDIAEVHEALVAWTEASTYTTYCGGGGCNGGQIGALVGTAPAATTGTHTATVTASVQSWADGTTNLGWILVPAGPGGVIFGSSENATLASRPLLTVVYDEGPPQANLVRNPYLQLALPTSMTIVWRTDTSSDSRVRYGTIQGSLNQSATIPAVVTNHIVPITDLTPATRYYYDVGSTTAVQAGGTGEHYFDTPPLAGSTTPFRVWILGDSGTGDSNQAAVRDAMLAYTGSNRPQMMLHVGDIAYTGGTEDEFTNNHFTPYQDIQRHTVSWPTLGNHEGSLTTSGQPGASTGPYYDAFVLPAAGEAGGAPSGTEAYYSYDYGNVHFISLNSYQVSRSPTGPMATWLQSDLQSTSQQWIIAYWHHPPYSKGTHNSDVEVELVQMRENILPILEAGGVDLVLAGHSHSYERSYLIDGTYSTPTPSFATLEVQGHILDDGDGKPSGDGAYQKPAGQNAHEGAVYVVAGHGGASTGGSFNHPVMYFSESNHGSCILDVDGNQLTLTNVRGTGVLSDTFSMVKGPLPPRVMSTTPPKLGVLGALGTIRVTFSVDVTGVDAGDLSVNGSPATTLNVISPATYEFNGFAPPGNGVVSVALAAGGIADAVNPLLLFQGDTWTYTIDTTPPHVASVLPARGRDIGVLPSITVNFSKPVTGVSADDLLVNGQPATSLSGVSDSEGPYAFSGYPAPTQGEVAITLLSGGILDDLAQPFAGDSWTYVLRQHLVINEFLASNNTAVTDENGEFDDYVEIYNPAPVPVDMSGMHLTDRLDFPAQYRIPAGVVIPAFGRLVFWCDSQPAQGPLHTNFNLLRTGEGIGLYDTDENDFAEIDTFTYPTQTTDLSSGRFPDGGAGYVSMPVTPGQPNTISCTTPGECTVLSNTCNTGACVSNLCVAQPANEGGGCDDGALCTDNDACASGVCVGTDSCTGVQQCNLVTGQCETPQGDPLPVDVGSLWKYFKGTSAPAAGWNDLGFDDSPWLSGASGFGYGLDCTTQRGTTLSDMQNPPSTPGYVSLYVRHLFWVDDPGLVETLTLTLDYDDAYVAYVNGTEVGRNNVVGSPPSNTALATADRECSTGAPANPPENVAINLTTAQLVAGNNVIAIQAHNLSLGSSDFTLIPSLAGTFSQGCTSGAQCNDGNDCTDDACLGGTCQNTADDTNACDDGVVCTSDSCSGGACVSASACPQGQTCNTGTGVCELTPVTVSFQDGVGGYLGTVDTFVNAAAPDANNSAVTPLVMDTDPSIQQALVRFDGIFGNNPGQIPLGATIQSASLTVNVTNPSANGASLHRMLQSWTDGDSYNTLGAGVQANDVEAVSTADISTTFNGTVPASYSFSVSTSLAAWSAGATNLGWAFLPNGTDSWQFDSEDVATASFRPLLSVTYTFSPPCSGDPECDDGNACNGLETCAGTCQPGTPLNCDDSNVCTTDSCIPASGCAHAFNANACDDGDACTTGDVCGGGVCVSGGPTDCDDANVCTTDSCASATGCAHVNTTDPCSDGNLCTTGDTCSGGTCVAAPVLCGPGETCNPSTGTCQLTPVSVSFQNGFSGYLGTMDTYIDAALGPQDSVSPIVVDGTPVEQVLLRFDGIFGVGPGQIPPGASIVSATLTLWVGTGANDQSANAVNFHRLLHAWNAPDVWAAYALPPWNAQAGIQADGTDAVVAADATATMSTAATAYPVDVTTSLQAWASDPASQFGWVILPTGADGLRLESSESTTASNARRPLLSVTYTGVLTCTGDPDCNDNNLCNGTETCVATVCQPGTPLTCNDGNPCTSDSCVPATGCAYPNNTDPCDDGDACTTGDACSSGACGSGAPTNCDDANVCTDDTCVSPTGCTHVANADPCSDGNLCTTGDLCAGGVCSGSAVTCPPGESCNPTTGQCETATAPPLPIVVGDEWRYFKGTAEPTPIGLPPTWASVGFDDQSWLLGPSGFGYGPDCAAQRNTSLGDMQNGYVSLYLRRQFLVNDPGAILSLTLTMDYDDAFVAYINGTEVARRNVSGTPPPFGQLATVDHECSTGTPPNPAEAIPLSTSSLVAGVNVIAIQAHNLTAGSSDFTLVPSLATTAGCLIDPDCDDANPCTDDVCSAGVCSNTTDDSNTCSDGAACTADACVAGACVGTSTCPPGQSCNTTLGACTITATFQQDVGGYAGTQDTYLAEATPTTVNGALELWSWDTDDPPSSNSDDVALLRFDDIVGTDPGQVPQGAQVVSATLTLTISEPGATPSGNIHRVLVAWDAASTSWSDFGGEAGVQADEYGAFVAPAPITVGTVDLAVTSTVQDWVSTPASNLGFVFLPSSPNGVDARSAEYTVVAERPRLVVEYVATIACSLDEDCNDQDVCTGVETCVASVCQPGIPLNCDDSNPCTDDVCLPATGCEWVPNSASCDDGDACTAGDVCSGGSCAGSPLSCDDGVACTTDACVAGSGCQHTSNCPGGGSCNLSTGQCTAARMICSLESPSTGPGSTVGLDVLLENLGGLGPVRAYQTQVTITRTSGTGTLGVGCPGGVLVDDARSDYLFFGSSTDYPATNCSLRRASSSLLTGGVSFGPATAYLSSYGLSVSADATAGSTFEISLDAPSGSAVVNPANQPIPFDRGPVCVLTVESCGSPCISGGVRYYRDFAGAGSEPSAKPVPNAQIDLLEDGQPPQATDSAGQYAFASQSGTRTVTTSDKWGSPRASDHNDAISSLDAAYIGQAAVSALTLSANQRLAGDVSGNGQISAFDAALVSQFAAELADHFPVATSSGSDWAFLRCDTYTDASSHDCGQPVFVHDPLTQSETDDFYAILYGDVTGNWMPAAPPFSQSAQARAEAPRPTDAARLKAAMTARSTPPSPLAVLSLEGVAGALAQGERRRIEIRIEGADGVLGLDLALGYDPGLVRVVGVETLGLGSEFQSVQNDRNGTLRIGIYGPLPMTGSGALLAVTVEALQNVPGGVRLQVSGQANEGAIPLRVPHGRPPFRGR